jgi:hypothetical protein
MMVAPMMTSPQPKKTNTKNHVIFDKENLSPDGSFVTVFFFFFFFQNFEIFFFFSPTGLIPIARVQRGRRPLADVTSPTTGDDHEILALPPRRAPLNDEATQQRRTRRPLSLVHSTPAATTTTTSQRTHMR